MWISPRKTKWSQSLDLRILFFEIPYVEGLSTLCEMHTWHRTSNQLFNNAHLNVNRQPKITGYLRMCQTWKRESKTNKQTKILPIENVLISKWVDPKTMVHLYNGILHSRKKWRAPTLRKSMGGSGKHYVNEVSQVVKDKYHMISPISGTWSTNQTNKKNITRDIEIKKKLTATKWEGEGIVGKKGKACQGTCIKDTWTKPKWGRIKGREWGWLGLGGLMAGKWRQLCLKNNFKKRIKK